MLYLPEMNRLVSPRPRAVTAAALLALVTAAYWLVVCVFLLLMYRAENSHVLRKEAIFQMMITPGCLGLGGAVAAIALLFRRNWGRVLALALAVSGILFVLNFLKPLLRLPSSLIPPASFLALCVFPILTGIAILPLLAGKKVRTELLPPAVVLIYVNLLDEAAPRARPTQALALGAGLFELLPTGHHHAHDEHWEIKPGSVVRGVKSNHAGKPCLLAVVLGSQ
jgi:hypothetical protein